MASLWQNGVAAIQWSVVLGGTLAAAWTDVTRRRIPNRLTAPMLFAGYFAAAWWAGVGGLVDSAVASVLLAAPYVLLFALARGGAGDAKLMAAVGAWLGTINGLAALAAVASAGVLMGIAWSLRHRRLCEVARKLGEIGVVASAGVAAPQPLTPARLQMPYAVAICIGAVAAAVGVAVWRM